MHGEEAHPHSYSYCSRSKSHQQPLTQQESPTQYKFISLGLIHSNALDFRAPFGVHYFWYPDLHMLPFLSPLPGLFFRCSGEFLCRAGRQAWGLCLPLTT